MKNNKWSAINSRKLSKKLIKTKRIDEGANLLAQSTSVNVSHYNIMIWYTIYNNKQKYYRGEQLWKYKLV